MSEKSCSGIKRSCPFFHETETASTNDLAKAYAETHKGDAVFLADRQTNGRGRGEHTFLSPEGGFYASFLLHPRGKADAVHLTVATAVAVGDALLQCTGVKTSVKWVNDLYVNQRKIAGILAEGAVENGALRYAVVGVGINLCDVSGVKEIAEIATSVEEQHGKIPDRTVLLAKIRKNLLFALRHDALTMRKYKKRNFVLGNAVTVTDGENTYPAYAVDIRKDGALVVRKSDGGEHILRAGEIHITV